MKYSHYFLICMLLLFQVSCNEEVPTIGNIEIKTTTVRAYSVEATIEGQLIVPKGRGVTEYGVAYGHDLNNLIYSASSESLTSEAFAQKIGDLTVSTNYYFAVYAKLKDGRVIYGDTLSRQTDKGIAPTISTTAATNFTLNTFDCGGSITEKGQSPVIRQGIVWGTTDTPADTILYTDLSKRQYTVTLSGLTTGTTYYYRAFAVNTGGVSLGEIKNLTFGVVNISTTTASNSTAMSFITGGNISNFTTPIQEKGIMYGTSPGTAIKKVGNEVNNPFSLTLEPLVHNTTYYYKAYATNGSDYYYGETKTIKTLDGIVTFLPVTTTNITATSATLGGNITSDGGSPITARGFCYSASPAPTIYDSKTISGSGTGNFTTSISGLLHNTTYYIRAYATNLTGIYYGTELIFKTLDGVAILITNPGISITATSITLGGNITSDGGSPITARGFCYSTSPTPTIFDSKTTCGYGIGNFTAPLSGLTPVTTYYFRAYATNIFGTHYGNEVSANMKLEDIEGNLYNVIQFGNQLWMAENLRTKKYNDGTNIREAVDQYSWQLYDYVGQYCFSDRYSYSTQILYNGYAALKGICPNGWHLPSNEEWAILENYLISNGYNYDGTLTGNKIAKSMASKSGWDGSSSVGTPGNDQDSNNSSGFNGLPVGIRLTGNIGTYGELAAYWWTSTNSDNYATYKCIVNNNESLNSGSRDKGYGIGVRCVKD